MSFTADLLPIGPTRLGSCGRRDYGGGRRVRREAALPNAGVARPLDAAGAMTDNFRNA